MAATYSGGMRRRLDLAMTLVGEPRIIFLDEPTTGLDPRSRRTMWEIIRELVAGGVTIFLTTQYLDEADELADRIGVLDHGRMVADGHRGRAQAADSRRPHRPAVQRRAALESAARLLARPAPDEAGLVLQVPYDGRARSLKDLLNRLETLQIPDPAVSVHTPDLDDVFFALTGQPLTEQPRTGQPGSDGGRFPMTAISLAARDSATMLRRDVRHSIRFPMMTISGITVPVVLLLLFVGVFGHALSAGLGTRWPGSATSTSSRPASW